MKRLVVASGIALTLLCQSCGSATGETGTDRTEFKKEETALGGSQSGTESSLGETQPSSDSLSPKAGAGNIDRSAAAILARKQVPILCYHQIRPYRDSDGPSARPYIVPPDIFREQMKALHDSGYTTILPDQLLNYLIGGEELPQKPVMIHFDDGCDEQYDITREILDPLNMKAAYFIMTVSINRPNYMKAEQIRALSDAGHYIGLHTWDHQNVKKLQGDDWVKQIEKPKATLEKITGKPVEHFAYPFGLWNPQAIPELQKRGIKAAYILSTSRDQNDPLYTIRRIIVPGNWSGTRLLNNMRSSF
ncbi:MAG TPA: polysaccharide deacetylase family protein [Flavihumibacter sp.]